MSNVFKLDDTLQIKNIAQLSNNTGYTGVWAETAAIGFYTGANAIRLLYAGNYNYTMPSSDGTLALVSQLSAYLPLAGGTLTGALNGTSALFSGAVRANNPAEGATGEGLIAGQSFKIDGTGTSQKAVMYLVSNVLSDTYASGLTAQFANFAGDKGFGFNLNTSGGYEVYVKNSTWNKALTISNTGAATFSNKVTTTGPANDWGLVVNGSTTLGQSYGANIIAGSNSSDVAFLISNYVGGDILRVLGSGAATFSSSVTATSVRLSDGNEIGWGANTTFLLGDSANNNFRFFTNNTEKVRITSSGNVGIGTTAPEVRLHIQAPNNLAALRLQNTAANKVWELNPSNPDVSNTGLTIWNVTDNTKPFHITDAGNIGIGTTAPQATLSIKGATNNTVIEFENGGATKAFMRSYDRTAGAYREYEMLADTLLFSTGSSPAERMRITSGGKLLVNRTATIFANSGHSIQGDVSSGGEPVLEVYNQSLSDSSPALACFKNSGTTSSSARFMQFYSDAGTIAMGGIVGNGTSNVQFASISDIRKKENVNKLNNSLNKIMALNPVSFNWKSNNEFVSAGFIAQEVENVFPEYVVENMLEENGITYKGLTGGMTGGIVPVLVKAIQELKAELDTLKNK